MINTKDVILVNAGSAKLGSAAAATTAEAAKTLKEVSKLPPSFWKNVQNALLFTGMAVFLDKLLGALADLSVRRKSPKYYKKMLDSHPMLKKEDPKVVAKYWASLYHFAPTMAQDPMAAGAFIRQSIMRGVHDEFGGPPPDTYETLSSVEDKLKFKKDPGKIRELTHKVVTIPFTTASTGSLEKATVGLDPYLKKLDKAQKAYLKAVAQENKLGATK